nr:hypothetical protein [Tanacetum cinerariifolium]
MIKMKSKHAGSTITKKKKIMTSSHYLRGRKRQDPAFVKRRITYVVQAANLVSFSRPKWPSTYAPAAER